jgi:hypothetical protein
MFNYSEWLIAGIIDGYKKGEISFCETTRRTNNYLAQGTITQVQANEIGIACPKPEEVIEETPVEEETPIEETEVTEEA